MKAKYSIENPGWELMAKYLAGEGSAAEQEAIEKWAAQSKENSLELEKAKILLEKTDDYFRLEQFNTGAAWKKTQQRLQPETVSIDSNSYKRKYFISVFYKYAAIFVLAFLVASAGYYFGIRNQQNNIYSEIIAAEKQVVNEYILPDGSMVALNSNSKLQFPKNFKSDVREVTITGEAFFNVVPNPEKPFIINAGNTQVKVLGTSFNVNAYPENERVEVVVETGKVQVLSIEKPNSTEPDEILLNPGEKGILLNSVGKLEKTVNTDANYLAWKTHNLVFENTPLREVIRYLNKTYYTEIHLDGENLENLALTAQFEQKPIDFILNVVQITFGLELKQENNVYILSESKTLNK